MASPKILILEDEGPIRSVLVAKFTDEGFTVLDAATGDQALEIAQREKPDVIMTDLVMYPMDGTTFLKRLREGGVWGAKVPSYVLSNQKDPELISQLKTIGISHYFNKSDTPLNEVVRIIKSDLAQ